MGEVLWLPEARGDIERLYEFLACKDIDAAAACAKAILDGAELLASSPRMGRPMDDQSGRRELFVSFGAGAYVLRYMLERPNRVVVIRVWHSREYRM
ncbi:MAG: type II toxin-antitoxin system RelE/ParE family toxin [Acidobacteriota bacterium]